MTVSHPLTTVVPDYHTLLAVMRQAGRAPSVHNTQPWHWIFDGTRLHLHTDPDRQLPAADPHGRQQIISCGAMLHHVRTIFAAHGWHTDTVRLPDPQRPGYLAMIEFRPWPDPPAGIGRRAAAIDRRYTDRLPMLPPADWFTLAPTLQRLVAPHDLELDVLGDEARSRLAAVSEGATAARRYDMLYQHEIQWWTGHSDMPEGVPTAALASDAESARVDVGRSFPRPPHSARRGELRDRSRLVVLSSYYDAAEDWLHTGEALSAVLLECTAAGLATCPLTHITELPAGRQTVASLLPHATVPQVVIRAGTVPDDEQRPPTPRRPLVEILEVRR
jgi:nitroreductase